MNPIIENAIAAAKPEASGNAAIAALKDAAPLVFFAESTLALNDIFRVPSMVESDTDDMKQWVSTPITIGGRPIAHCICLVNNGTSERSVHVHLGSFFKQVKNRENGTLVSSVVKLKDGTILDHRNCVNKFEQWQLVAGRTFKVTAAETVPVQKRSRTNMQLYDADTVVFTFEEQ